MPKKTKAETAPVAEQKSEAKPKVKATKKAEPKVEKVEPVEATPVVAATESKEVPGLTEDFSGFMAKLQQATQMLSSLKNDFRTLEKKATREIKLAQKVSAKRKRKSGNRSPSGFVKPTLISNELAAFLGKEKGTEMARTDVTREINAYIRANNLQDPSNGRKINADKNLSSLLKLEKTDEHRER